MSGAPGNDPKGPPKQIAAGMKPPGMRDHPSPPAKGYEATAREITWVTAVDWCEKAKHLNPSIRKDETGRELQTLAACSKCIAAALRSAAAEERERCARLTDKHGYLVASALIRAQEKP